MAITIIFAPPRTGKTAFMTYLANEYAFSRQRYKAMIEEIEQKNHNGFCLTIPYSVVCSNYDMEFIKFGYSHRRNIKINPFRLGFVNSFVKTHFIAPYSVICITEAQKYLNSRMSRYFPDWQSRWYEQHGHNFLDIYLDTQRPMLIDVNIRELSQFIEIVKLDKIYKEGKIKQLIWTIRKIANSSEFDRYMSSGKKDNSCYEEQQVICNYNIFKIYDSQNCKPLFYKGHFDETYLNNISEPIEENMEGYIKYLEELDDELPKGYYKKGA